MQARSSVVFVTLLSVVAVSACSKNQDNGSAQKANGHLEAAFGSLTDNEKLKKQGKKDEVVGGVKGTLADVKDTLHNATKPN